MNYMYNRKMIEVKPREKPTPEMNALLKKSADFRDQAGAMQAAHEVAKALTESMPIQQGVLYGDILGNIFQPIDLTDGSLPEFQLDVMAPGTEKDFSAYTVPGLGRIPERSVESDVVMVNVYEVDNAIDWPLQFSENARWDVAARNIQILEGGFVLKANIDGWHLLIRGGAGRNLVVYDDLATAGIFSGRLVTLGQETMRRRAGGNSTSLNRGRMTDLYVSPEGRGDVRSWNLTQLDDLTRRLVFTASTPDGADGLPQLYGTNLHDLDELGVDQDFQKFYTNTLGGTFPGSKLELAIGLDLLNKDSFVNPIRKPVEIFPDELMHRQRRAGYYGWMTHGFGLLDARRVMLLAF